MSEPNEFSVSAVNRKRAETGRQPAGNAPAAAPQPVAAAQPAGAEPADGGLTLPFDPLRLVDALARHWLRMLLMAAIFGALALLVGFNWFVTEYTATAQFIKQEVPNTFRVSEVGEPFRPRQLTLPTLVGLMKSFSVLERTCARAKTTLTPRGLLGGLTITPERNTDLIKVSLKTSFSEQATLELLNVFGQEVVLMTRETQAQEAAEMNKFLKQQLAKADKDMAQINAELLAFSKESQVVDADKELEAELRKLGELDMKYETMRLDYETLDLKIGGLVKELGQHNPLAAQLQSARGQLAQLLNTYTEANPIVQSQRAQVTALEKQLKESAPQTSKLSPQAGEGGTVAAGLYMELVTLKSQKEVFAAQHKQLEVVREAAGKRLASLPEKSMQHARIKARQQSLETARTLLSSRQREAQLFEDSALAYCRFFEGKPQDIEVSGRGKKIIVALTIGIMAGALLCALLICLVESLDDRLKTPADVKRATRLPLVASLPDVKKWEAGRLEAWAFRTWMALQSHLASGLNQSFVCGFVSVGDGEGRSTWIRLLAGAASQRECRVVAVTNGPPAGSTTISLADVLAQPSHVAQAAANPTGGAVWVRMDEDWQWSAERRRQWQSALAQWQQRALVVLVELAPAHKPETSLMAEMLPNLVWVVGGGQARGHDTAEQLESLRQARCHFVGAVLNREPQLRIPIARSS